MYSIEAERIEARTCWICLESESEDTPRDNPEPRRSSRVGRMSSLSIAAILGNSNSTPNASPLSGPSSRTTDASAWVHPCRCLGLDAHHLCLLRFVAERRTTHPGDPVKCPVCLYVYDIDEEADWLGAVLAFGDRATRSLVPYATFTAISATVYIMSTAYGAYAIVATCGPQLADSILSDDGMWGSRTWIGMPMIPIALIASRLDIADNVLPVLPFLILSNQQPISITLPPSPTVTLCFLPWARAIYKEIWRLVYHLTISKSLTAASTTLNPNTDTTINNTAVVGDEQPIANAQPQGFPPPAPPRRPGPPSSLPRLLMGALLLPAIASFAGTVLGAVPFLRSKLPSVFLRSTVGAGLVILGRDIILYWDFVRRRKRAMGNGRRIRDFAG
ncbi:hypothetical protein BJ741DRAFT_621462 [Chytriomyces cf. hyalinus JEL632]|nr:hypothetical protein BJ741DRAFT_621462 [Chytriomyces cf. hyalinus JEL632]